MLAGLTFAAFGLILGMALILFAANIVDSVWKGSVSNLQDFGKSIGMKDNELRVPGWQHTLAVWLVRGGGILMSASTVFAIVYWVWHGTD